MSRETDFETVMEADATLMAILTGGVHTRESLGDEGLARETVPTAFDSNGFLKPCSVVRQRAAVNDGAVDDMQAQEASVQQVVELWFYDDSGFTNIDSAKARSKVLFHGYQFNDSFPLEWAGEPITRDYDRGALNGRPMARQDWSVIDIQ